MNALPYALDGTRRTENTFVHELMPLSPNFSDTDASLLTLEKARAMLIFVPLGLNDHLLSENTASTAHLKGLLYKVCQMLNPNGTIILSSTVPYFKHAGHIAGECTFILLHDDDGGLYLRRVHLYYVLTSWVWMVDF